MDNGLWKLQQEARVRVATQRAREHRVAEEQNRRTAASLRAARPPMERPPEPVKPVCLPPPQPEKPAMDSEQILLLLLALLLAQAGANRLLVLAILYLAL